VTTCVGSAKAPRQRLFAFEPLRGEYAADSAAESDLPSHPTERASFFKPMWTGTSPGLPN
jgi:hypothetical protein